MRCDVSMSETTRMSPAVVRYAVEAGGAPACRARNAATIAQARLACVIVWRDRKPATMSPRAATKTRIAGCDTGVHEPPSPTRRRSSALATCDSSGRATSATASGWLTSAPRSHRPAGACLERSVIHASAARSSGSRTVKHVNTTRAVEPIGSLAPATWTSARSATTRTSSARTSWLRLKRQPSSIPPPKTNQGATGISAANESRSAPDRSTTSAASSRMPPGRTCARSRFSLLRRVSERRPADRLDRRRPVRRWGCLRRGACRGRPCRYRLLGHGLLRHGLSRGHLLGRLFHAAHFTTAGEKWSINDMSAQTERIAEFKEVAELMPDDPVVRFGLAGAYLDAGLAEDAVAEYREAIRLKPDYTAAYRGLGRALERAGRPDEARAAYGQGLEVAQRTGDLQTKKEIEVFLRRLGRA